MGCGRRDVHIFNSDRHVVSYRIREYMMLYYCLENGLKTRDGFINLAFALFQLCI